MFYNLVCILLGLCVFESVASAGEVQEQKLAPVSQDFTTLQLEYESFFPIIFSSLQNDPLNKNSQDNRLNRFLSKRDQRGYLKTPYAAYTRELTPSEKEDGKRRMGRFVNKWMLTAINEKYGIFERTWRNNKKSSVGSHTLSETSDGGGEKGIVSKLRTDVSYRLRTDRTEIELKNDLFNVIGKAYYEGHQEFTFKKHFAGLGLETFYHIRPGQDTGDLFAIEKMLPYYLKAKTSYGKERLSQEESPISSAKVELLYNENF